MAEWYGNVSVPVNDTTNHTGNTDNIILHHKPSKITITNFTFVAQVTTIGPFFFFINFQKSIPYYNIYFALSLNQLE